MIVTLATFAMGTRFELVLAGADEAHLRAAGEEAIAEIELWHQRLNYFAPDSLVTRLNALAVSRPVSLDPETFALLARCLELHEQTGGAFDITIAPLMRQFGFRDHPLPFQAGGHGAGRIWGSRHIQLDPVHRTIRFTRAGLEIDLGGIAKGFALDRAEAILREHGITCALLHGGTSSVIAIGGPPDEEGWTIRIPAAGATGKPGLPVADSQMSEQTTGKRSACPWHPDNHICVTLCDQALSVSAPHGRTVERRGETLGHIIDPRTGAPARGADLAAAICRSATDAEAWSTALLVLNRRPENLRQDLRSILYDHQNGWRKGGTVEPLRLARASSPHCQFARATLRAASTVPPSDV